MSGVTLDGRLTAKPKCDDSAHKYKSANDPVLSTETKQLLHLAVTQGVNVSPHIITVVEDFKLYFLYLK